MPTCSRRAADPKGAHHHDVKKLQDRGGYRLRGSDWHVIFDRDGTITDIATVHPGGGACQGPPRYIERKRTMPIDAQFLYDEKGTPTHAIIGYADFQALTGETMPFRRGIV